MQNMLWYLLWAIGPMIPATLIYRLLPKSESTVDGVFKGMQIKLGGAAAFYFIIFFVMNPVKLGLINRESTQSRWDLVTSFRDGQNQVVPSEELLAVEAIPNIGYTALDNENVIVSLPTIKIDEDKNIVLPYRLRFIFKNYEPRSISSNQYFNKQHLEVSWEDRSITLKNLPALRARYTPNHDTTVILPASEQPLTQ